MGCRLPHQPTTTCYLGPPQCRPSLHRHPSCLHRSTMQDLCNTLRTSFHPLCVFFVSGEWDWLHKSIVCNTNVANPLGMKYFGTLTIHEKVAWAKKKVLRHLMRLTTWKTEGGRRLEKVLGNHLEERLLDQV